MKYLWADWDKLGGVLSSGKEKLLLLDFDGTLLPIARSPDAVFLSPDTRNVLETLSRTPRLHLAIVSGRPLKELRAYLKLEKVFYVANHGLEMKGIGLSLPASAKKARKLRRLIFLLARKFESVFLHNCEGVWVEDKNFTLSLHYRNLPKEQQVYFTETVNFLKEKYKRHSLLWTAGKRVWEIRPSVFWGKGDAALCLIQKFPDALPVAIGDDRADEEMFEAVESRGITIRVGRLQHSRAQYYLESPYDVRVFLKRLCQ